MQLAGSPIESASEVYRILRGLFPCLDSVRASEEKDAYAYYSDQEMEKYNLAWEQVDRMLWRES